VLAPTSYPRRLAWIAQLDDLPADITQHALRYCFASLAADLGYNEPIIASLLGPKIHSNTSRYMHSAAAVNIHSPVTELGDVVIEEVPTVRLGSMGTPADVGQHLVARTVERRQ